MRWGFLCLLALSVSVRTSESSPPTSAAVGRAIDAYAKPLITRGDLSGQLLVLRSGKVLIERSFGMANHELGVPMTPETRINIASVTKPMTATIAVQLIQEKKFGIDDPISMVPGFSQRRFDHGVAFITSSLGNPPRAHAR